MNIIGRYNVDRNVWEWGYYHNQRFYIVAVAYEMGFGDHVRNS